MMANKSESTSPPSPSLGTAGPVFDPAIAPLAPDDTEGDASELSPIGMLCQDILGELDRNSQCPDETKNAIASRVSRIYSIFTENESTVLATKKRISKLKSELRNTKEQLIKLRNEHFGQSSEKVLADDDETELTISNDFDDDDDDICEKQKGKRVRRIPDDIEINEVYHFPLDRTCFSCGCEMASISKWGSTRYKMIPEHVVAVKNIHHTCACNRELCKENKPVASKSTSYTMRGRGMEPSFVVEAAAQKFHEHIPTFRMERRLWNNNVNLSRQAISAGIAHMARQLEPIRIAFLEEVKAGHAAHMDETPVRVLAPGKGKTDTGYFWAICRDERRWNLEAHPVVAFQYSPLRSGTVTEELLSGSSLHFLQTDGFSGYNRLFKDVAASDGLRSLRCWAHARRKFRDAVITTDSPLAKKIVLLIKGINKVEVAAAGLPPFERETMRQERTLPVLCQIRAELLKHETVAQGTIRQAINYTLNSFDALQRFVLDGKLEIDNNPVERCIRGLALTKKNSLFAGSHEAAKVWAVYYSLIETARLNRVNPRCYLKWVVDEIERTRGECDYSQLTPWHCPVGHIQDK